MRRFLALAMLAGPAFGQYAYYFTNSFGSITPGVWQQNGTLSTGASGLTTTDANGGALISTVGVPDGSSSYEVRATMRWSAGGGTYVQYLRASSDAKTGPAATGTFYSVEWSGVSLAAGCQVTLSVKQRVSGVMSELANWTTGCRAGVDNVAQAVVRDEGHLLIYLNGVMITWLQPGNPIQTGKGGVGVIGAPAVNGIVKAELGPLDQATVELEPRYHRGEK